jgi:hypothetical protein
MRGLSLTNPEVVMRRICLVGAALAGSLVFGVATAPAAKTQKPKKVKPTKVMCKLTVSVSVPSGDTQLALPASDGSMYGSASCPKEFGGGIAAYGFTLQDDGDLTGAFRQYYLNGTVHGTYDLSPADSSPSSPSTFLSQSYTGTGTVEGGSGAFKGATGTSTMTCTTPDSVHMSCTERLKLTLPPAKP